MKSRWAQNNVQHRNLQHRNWGGVALLLVFTAGAAVVNSAWAQTAPVKDPNVLEEIVVTAQKRAQKLQDVGISVTAFSGDKLTQLGFNSTVDIVRQTPGANILSSSASNTNVNIRGVSQNDFADHLEGPIAVYADEGYLGAAGAINGQSFDVDRVEVLRGPQGTLFGRNATGGLIHYISRAPKGEFGGYLQFDAGQYGLLQFEGAVNAPISETVRTRFSFAGVKDDGYVKNPIGPTPGNRDNYSARFQVAMDLSDRTELRLMVNGNTNGNNERGLAGSAVAATINPQTGLGVFVPGAPILNFPTPSDPNTRSINSPGKFQKDVGHVQAKLTSDLGSGTSFTSITDYLYLRKNFIGQDVEGTPAAFFGFNTFMQYNQYSQEFRLAGQSGKLKWITGAYFLRMRGHYGSGVDFGLGLINPFVPANLIISTHDDYTLDTDSVAVFGQGEYALSDTLSATLGLRYTDDQKEVDYLWFDNVGDPIARYNTSTDPKAKASFKNVSAKAQLDWRPMDGVLAYASYSRGTKGGNWALPVFPPPINALDFPTFPHKQEVLNDYEIGLKTEFWGRRARFNIGAFYYDYKDYQAFSLAGLKQSIENKDATASGGEVEFVITPMTGLEMSLGAAFMNSEVKRVGYPSPPGGFYNPELPFSPSLTVNGLIRYEWPAFGGKLAAQTSFTSVGGHYFTVANEPVNYEDRYFTADARLTYTSGGDSRWNASLWVKNLNDEEYRTFGVDIAALGFAGRNFAPPRWYGVSLGYKF